MGNLHVKLIFSQLCGGPRRLSQLKTLVLACKTLRPLKSRVKIFCVVMQLITFHETRKRQQSKTAKLLCDFLASLRLCVRPKL